MKTLTILLALSLAACSSTIRGRATQPQDDAGADPAPDAGDPAADASTPDVDAGQADSGPNACDVAACTGAGAQCGQVTTDDTACGAGYTASCGGCTTGQACGDNGNDNRCGDTCLDVETIVDACNALGAGNFAWGVSAACVGTPFKLDSQNNATWRALGHSGCGAYPSGGGTIECCI